MATHDMTAAGFSGTAAAGTDDANPAGPVAAYFPMGGFAAYLPSATTLYLNYHGLNANVSAWPAVTSTITVYALVNPIP